MNVLARVGPPPGVHTLVLKASAGGSVAQRQCSFRVAAVGTRTPAASFTATGTPTPTVTPAVSATPTRTANAALHPQLTTTRGCAETGQQPAYHVGEVITVSFQVDSDVVSQLSATLFDILANGLVNTFSLGTLTANHPYSFEARIAPPLGVEKLQLRARAAGVPAASVSCSFSIVP